MAGGLVSFLEACAPAVAPSPSATSAGSTASPSPTPTPTPRPEPTGDITLAFFGTPLQEAAWVPIIEGFTKAYPKITVKAEGIVGTSGGTGWSGYLDALTTRIAGGDPPDVSQVATEGMLWLARIAEPIEAYIERDRAEIDANSADIHPRWSDLLKKVTPEDGHAYFLPGDFNTMGIWYNAELFEQAGIPDPSPDWTWDDFEAICAEIVRPGVFAYNIDINGGAFQFLAPWLFTNGATWTSDDWKTATINTEAAIEAVTFERMLVARGYSPEPGGTFDQYAVAAQGNLAMIGAGAWPQNSLSDQLDRWRIVPWPQKVKKGSPIGWNSFPLLKSSANKEAAWEFVKFLSSPGQTASGPRVPLHESLVEDWAATRPTGIRHLYDALDYAEVPPSPLNASAVARSLADHMTQILLGNVEVAAGLEQLNTEMQANL